MLVVGLTGSIATGKSEVAKRFQARAIPVFDADAQVHSLYASPEGVAMVQAIVPDAIINARVDRQRLGDHLTKHPNLLTTLETGVHAVLAGRRQDFLSRAWSENHQIVVLDIPLLFEKNMEHDVDLAIVVSSPPHLQCQRALARPGMTLEKLEMILARQLGDLEKRRRADFVIENDGTLDQLHQRTDHLIDVLLAKAKHA